MLAADPKEDLLARDGRDTTPASAALEACANIAMRRGTVSRTSVTAGEERTVTLTEEPPHQIQAVEHEGFNLDASVRIDGDDDLARERLCRYGARPPFALERFGRRPDGSVTYRLKKARAWRAREGARDDAAGAAGSFVRPRAATTLSVAPLPRGPCARLQVAVRHRAASGTRGAGVDRARPAGARRRHCRRRRRFLPRLHPHPSCRPSWRPA